MKFVLAHRAKGPANRAEAWGCVTANLAFPGSGSLAAGKAVGYYQLALYAVGFIISVVTGIHLLAWSMGHGTVPTQSSGDPFEDLINLWHEIRGPVAGLCVAAVAFLWAGITSMQILSTHP